MDSVTVLNASMGVFPPIFHRFRHKGIYVFRFFKEENWRYVIIDKRIPIYDGAKEYIYSHCTDGSELWVPLIEKAYAKMFGCYYSLVGGFIDEALTDLTSLPSEKLKLHNRDGTFKEDKEDFWRFLMECRENNSLMGCSRASDGGKAETHVIIDGFHTGILARHAYGIMDVFEIPAPDKDKTYVAEWGEDIKCHRLLRIRNPWGKQEWQGKWSIESETDELILNQDAI